MQIPDHISASYIKNCYKNTSLSKSKSSKKLASGYRINTAADDAAKLSISEKMRAQIRGLDQASNNIQDSISFLQVADGALETASTIMQRIRELAVQAANDTYTDQDRDQMQQECNQLQAEMLSIFDQSAFHSKKIFTAPDLPPEEISKRLLQNQLPLFDEGERLEGNTVPADTLNLISRTLRLVAFTQDLEDRLRKGKVTWWILRTDMTNYLIEFIDYAKELNGYGEEGYGESLDWKKTLDGMKTLANDALALFKTGTKADLDTGTQKLFDINTMLCGILEKEAIKDTAAARYINTLNWIIYAATMNGTISYLQRIRSEILSGADGLYKSLENVSKANLKDTSLLQSLLDGKYTSSFETLAELSGVKGISLSLQSGANANQGSKLRVVISDVPKSPFQLSSHINANASIDKADRFLTQLTAARSEIGAYQNRLESALSYTGQGAEALQDTESRMRDANMAKEAADYAKTKLQNEFQLSFLAQKNASHNDLSVLSFPKE